MGKKSVHQSHVAVAPKVKGGQRATAPPVHAPEHPDYEHKGAESISGLLIHELRRSLWFGTDRARQGGSFQHHGNLYTPMALSAYVLAVAAVEAYVNESYTSFLGRSVFRESPIWDLGKERVERFDVVTKILLICALVHNKLMPTSQEPMQGFMKLVQIRNDIVHYKMNDTPPKYLRSMTSQNLALPGKFTWPSRLCCTEGALWAHNTACMMVQSLVSRAAGDKKKFLLTSENFAPIQDLDAWFTAAAKRPSSLW